MIDLVKAAVLNGGNKQQQRIAQAALISRRNQNPQLFLLEGATIFSNNSIQNQIRQATGVLLTVSIKYKNQLKFLWDRVSTPKKLEFKDLVLGAMIDPSKQIRRAAANIVASICVIEIPRGEWTEIVDKIASNITYEDPAIKQVSILTLGFICQNLKEFNFTFEEGLQTKIVTGISLGLKENREIAETAFKALRDSMACIQDVMKNQTYRQFLLNHIAQAIRTKTFIQLGLQCLLEFVKYHFTLINATYVEGFYKVIEPILLNYKEQTECVVAIQFWANLARQEQNIQDNPEMRKFITGNLAVNLVNILLQTICIVDKNDQQGNGISQAADNALQAIFEGNSLPYQQQVINFVGQTLTNEDWKLRQASIRAFALLLLGLPEERSQTLVNSGLINLVALLADSNLFVRKSAAKSFILITQQVPSVILKHQNFMAILQVFMTNLSTSPFFIKSISNIVSNLAKQDSEFQISRMGQYVQNLIPIFLELSQNTDHELPVINSLMSVIMQLIKCSKNTNICRTYIQYVLNNFQNISRVNFEKRQTYYSGYFIILQIALITMRKNNGSITIQILSKIYNLVVQYFKGLKDVEANGYYVIGALVFFIPNDRRLVDDFWKCIEFGFQKLNQEEVFKASINCICNFTELYGDKIFDKIQLVFNQILAIYESTQVSKQIKFQIMIFIGQIFLQCGELAKPYYNRVMQLLIFSCRGVLQLTDINYAEIAQDNIIETILCIIHGIPNDAEFVKYIPYIFQFVKVTTETQRHPKLEYVKSSMTLLADIASYYPNNTTGYIKNDIIIQRTRILQKYNGNGRLQEVITYVKNIFRFN